MYYSNSQQRNSVPFYQERRKFFLQNAVFFAIACMLYTISIARAMHRMSIHCKIDRLYPVTSSEVSPVWMFAVLFSKTGSEWSKKALFYHQFFMFFFRFLKKNQKNDYLICLSFIYKPYFDIWGSGNIGI